MYHITDVEDLHNWMYRHCEEHQLFEKVEDAKNDPCVGIMLEDTEEGKKVEREGRQKYWAVWRRVEDPIERRIRELSQSHSGLPLA